MIGSLSFFRLLVDGTAVVAEGGGVEVEGAAAAAVEKKADVAGAVVARVIHLRSMMCYLNTLPASVVHTVSGIVREFIDFCNVKSWPFYCAHLHYLRKSNLYWSIVNRQFAVINAVHIL